MDKILEISDIGYVYSDIKNEPIATMGEKSIILFFIEKDIKWNTRLEYPSILETDDNSYILKHDEGISKIEFLDNSIETIPYLQFHRKQTLYYLNKDFLVLLDRTEGKRDDFHRVFLTRILQVDIKGNFISKSELLDIALLPYFYKHIMIFIDFAEEKKIHLFNLTKNKIDWIFDLEKFRSLCQDEDYRDTNPSPTIIEVNEKFVLLNSWHGTGAISTVTGELIWFKEGVMIEKCKEKYVWISSKVYQEYDPMTGNVLYSLNISSELAQYRLHSTVHNFAFIDDIHLIFTDNIASKLVLFNTQTGKVEWQYAFTDKKGNKVRLMSNPLHIFRKKVYVLDLENTLHIFEHVVE